MTDTADRVYSLSEPAQVALVALVVRGMKRGEPSPAEAELVEQGLATCKGVLLIPVGQAATLVGSMLRMQEGTEAEARVRALLEAFLPINRRLRELCTAWQCRPDGSANDHSDAMYDAAVRDRLDDIHDAVLPVLGRMSADLPGIGVYPARLEQSLELLDAGDPAWLTSPLLDSYHTVWMHLHQELLLSLGISRKEDEELEERLVSGRAG
jgi:hypothetical protein